MKSNRLIKLAKESFIFGAKCVLFGTLLRTALHLFGLQIVWGRFPILLGVFFSIGFASRWLKDAPKYI